MENTQQKTESFPEHLARINECASRLAVRLPFIATLFSSMKRSITKQYPTACVGGMHVRFNPDFMDTLDDEELLFVAAHEALHVAFLHSYRVGDRDRALWNIAGDACINLELKGTGLKMPTKNGKHVGVLIDWVKDGDTAEHVYQKLMEEAEKNPQQGSGGWGGSGDLEEPDPSDGKGDGEGEDGEGKGMSEIDVVTMVMQAAKVAFASGDKSTMLERIVGVARMSNTDWKEELRTVCTTAARNDYSFRRFNRRFVHKGLYLPTLYSEEMGELVVGVDESGSMSQHQLNVIQQELIPIVEDVRPSKVIVMYCHTRVHRVEEFEQGEEIRLKLTESGGTDMVDILRKIEERGLRPAACIIFTDLETPFPDQEPEYPLLWGAVGARKDIHPPVGRRVEVPV